MNKEKDVLDITRDLGYAIVDSKEYQGLIKAEENFYNDLELSKNLSDLEALTDESELIKLEEKINNSSTMKNLIEAREKYDKLFKNINNLISYMTDEESRIKLKKKKSGCGGCTSSCSGCSNK